MLKFSGFADLTSCLKKVRGYSRLGISSREMHGPATPRCVIGFAPQGETHDLNVSRAQELPNTQPHLDSNTTVVDHAAGIKWLGH